MRALQSGKVERQQVLPQTPAQQIENGDLGVKAGEFFSRALGWEAVQELPALVPEIQLQKVEQAAVRPQELLRLMFVRKPAGGDSESLRYLVIRAARCIDASLIWRYDTYRKSEST